MATIPLGAGRRVLPGRSLMTQVADVSAPARALQGIGAAGVQFGLQQLARQDAEAEAKRDAAERVQANSALDRGRAMLRQRAASITDRILSGEDLPDPKLSGEWSGALSDTLAEVTKGLPQDLAQNIGGTLRGVADTMGIDAFGNARRQRLQEATRANVLDSLEVYSRDAVSNRTRAVAMAQNLLSTAAPAAGWGADDVAHMLQQFKERSAFDAGAYLVSQGEADPALFPQVRQRLHSDEFADLPPERARQLDALIDTTVERRANEVERAAQQARRDAMGRVLLQVEQGERIQPNDWILLDDGQRAQVLNRQKAEARARRAEEAGRPVRTDWTLYLTLRDQAIADPKTFRDLDLRQYVDRIGGAQLEQLQDLKGKLLEQATRADKAPREVVTLTAQMNATMALLGIRRPADKGRFISYVTTAVDDAQQAKGKALSFEERRQIIDQAVLQGPDPDRILPWGERRMYQLDPEQRARFQPNEPTDAPATEIPALNEALRQQGIPETPANRLALYRRAVAGGSGQ